MTILEKINDVRAMLDFLEANPSFPLPYALSYDRLDWGVYCHGNKATFLNAAKQLGTCVKQPSSDDDMDMQLVKYFGKFASITVQAERAAICEKVVVGIKEVEIIEWKCPSILEQIPEVTAQ